MDGWENERRVPVTWHEHADHPGDDTQGEPDQTALGNPALVLARRLVGLMLADPDPRMGIECLSVVVGIGWDGSSLAAIARRHKRTRAAVSKRCGELAEALGMDPTSAMRPEANRRRCRAARFRSLARM